MRLSDWWKKVSQTLSGFNILKKKTLNQPTNRKLKL